MENKINENFKANTKTKYDKFLNYCLLLYFIMAFTAFFIPINILDKSEICANFVNFMKGIFPNIEAFSKVSKIQQHTEFFVSFMWIWTILVAFAGVIVIITKSDTAFKKLVTNFALFITIIFVFGFLGFLMIREVYLGLMTNGEIGFGRGHFVLQFKTKFNDFWWITFFQIWFFAGCYLITTSIAVITHLILQKINLKDKK